MGGGYNISRKHYEGVRFYVISVTRGWVRWVVVKFSEKNIHYQGVGVLGVCQISRKKHSLPRPNTSMTPYEEVITYSHGYFANLTKKLH